MIFRPLKRAMQWNEGSDPKAGAWGYLLLPASRACDVRFSIDKLRADFPTLSIIATTERVGTRESASLFLRLRV